MNMERGEAGRIAPAGMSMKKFMKKVSDLSDYYYTGNICRKFDQKIKDL